MVIVGKNLQSQTLSHYFTTDVTTRHLLNPAFQPVSKYYISIPIIGNTEFNYSNNSFSLNDAVNKDINPFYNKLQPQTRLSSNLRANLFSAGWGNNNTYFTLNIAQKSDVHLNLSKDFFNLLIYGTPDKYDNFYKLNGLGFSGNLYTETAFGISQQFNEQWTIGVKLKFLSGNANTQFYADNLNVTGGVDNWNIAGKAQFGYSGAADFKTDKLTELGALKFPTSNSDWLKMNGAGAGLDFGINFRMLENMYISLSVNDLGLIRWRKNILNNKLNIDYNFDGFVQLNSTMTNDEINSAFNNMGNVNQTLDSLLNDMKQSIGIEVSEQYTTYTSPNLYFAAEYRFLNDKLTTGMVFHSKFQNTFFANKITSILNFKPFDWLNTTLSYSFLNGYNSIGGGLNLTVGVINFFSYFDAIPYSFSKLKFSNSVIPFPYRQNVFNFSAGFNIAFGKREKFSEYITNKPYHPKSGLYRPKFKKMKFLWDI